MLLFYHRGDEAAVVTVRAGVILELMGSIVVDKMLLFYHHGDEAAVVMVRAEVILELIGCIAVDTMLLFYCRGDEAAVVRAEVILELMGPKMAGLFFMCIDLRREAASYWKKSPPRWSLLSHLYSCLAVSPFAQRHPQFP